MNKMFGFNKLGKNKVIRVIETRELDKRPRYISR